MTCQEHGKETSTKCQWCARPICDVCVEAANGYRLCESCAQKLAKDKPLEKRHGLRGPVKNVDVSISDERAKAIRKELEQQKEPKRPRIRNVPDEWPRLE